MLFHEAHSMRDNDKRGNILLTRRESLDHQAGYLPYLFPEVLEALAYSFYCGN